MTFVNDAVNDGKENMPVRILAISGSLRARSSNSALLRAAAEAAPDYMAIACYDGLGTLPPFNPDLDSDGELEAPAPVADLRRRLKEADGVLICTPEYAGGLPGALKNALDWVVSSGEFYGKRTAAISASPSPAGGERALASLLVTLGMLTADMPEGAALTVPFVSSKLDGEGRLADPDTLLALKKLLHTLQPNGPLS
ncbi:NADPH-dependent FMN reductase [Paenibacillus humicola]|uniref:NADPH-dependent FMN reductase n=1 Tax=Paenibacillus humicola TaxID=3110540 RepID=UPI00237C125F|nr:NADPH-dependent FMN reductase [Paenibacillus humicola]